MDSIFQRIVVTVKQVVEWLVTGDFVAIERYTNGERLTANLISEAISEYGHKLVMPPSDAFDQLDLIEVVGVSPRKWSVRFDLWTEREGRSDLSLECTLIYTDEGLLAVEVDNIHVL
ncbi:DUF7668 domain-containing protein [Methylomonas sp. BW4-1]|uniref:DUF7668 domain-containing protein n=1 Tax=Methylomonas sp. BW4-1 TaxID=3376685 RepID=UPI0040425877